MDVDQILRAMNNDEVDFLLIGGMNFLLRHEPVLTFDVDLWIDDNEANRRRCELALGRLDAEWGRADDDWGPVALRAPGWLDQQTVFCLSSPAGAIDIFRSVVGLVNWAAVRARAVLESTQGGVRYWGICDEDMLKCQLALETPYRRTQRVASLEKLLKGKENHESQ